jgi:hypothetical protein
MRLGRPGNGESEPEGVDPRGDELMLEGPAHGSTAAILIGRQAK